MTSHRAAVVSAYGSVTGIVGEDILVIPNMSPTYTEDVIRARGVVAEVGGALVHLAVVCRELGKTMMIMPGSCETLMPGMRVTLVPGRCEIRCEESPSPVTR